MSGSRWFARMGVLGFVWGLGSLLVPAVGAEAAAQGEVAPDAAKSRDVEWSAIFEAEWAVGTSGDERGEAQKLEVEVRPRLEATLGSGWRLFGEARLRGDRYDRLEPGRPNERQTSSPASRRWLPDERSEVELRELYLERAFGGHRIVLGKQQVVWGQADGFKILDVVNPQDFREWLLDDFDQSRIPLWTAMAEIALGSAQLQLLVIPDDTHHRLLSETALFGLPGLGPAQGVELVEADPEEEFEWGGRLTAFWGGWDLGLAYLRRSVDFPVVEVALESTPTAVLRYPFTDLVGVTASNAFGRWTLRAEVAHETDREYQGFLTRFDVPVTPDLDRLGTETGAETAGVIGLDLRLSERHFLSVQGFRIERDFDGGSSLLAASDSLATLVYRGNTRSRRFAVEFLSLHGLDEDEGLVRATASVELRPDFVLRFGWDGFYGPSEGQIGRLAGLDRFRLGVRVGL